MYFRSEDTALCPLTVFLVGWNKSTKKQQILSPREYHEILQNFGTLKILGTDWGILNFKKCADNITKKKFPFLMRELRIFNYEKGSENVSVQNTYTGNGNQYAIQKKTMLNNKWQNIYHVVNAVNEKNHISELKRETWKDFYPIAR